MTRPTPHEHAQRRAPEHPTGGSTLDDLEQRLARLVDGLAAAGALLVHTPAAMGRGPLRLLRGEGQG
jgi:hypothetical protein